MMYFSGKMFRPDLYDLRVHRTMHHSKLGKLQLNHPSSSSATTFAKLFHPTHLFYRNSQALPHEKLGGDQAFSSLHRVPVTSVVSQRHLVIHL